MKVISRYCSNTYCGREFKPRKSNHYYCDTCLKLRGLYKEPEEIVSETVNIGPAQIGAANELLVSAYFLKNGYYVFRNYSNNSPCDLIITRRGETPIKVEVTTGKLVGGSLPGWFSPKNEDYDFDLICVVYPDGIRIFTREEHELLRQNKEEGRKIIISRRPSRVQ